MTTQRSASESPLKPDFSGEWQLNRDASTLSPTVAAVVESGALRIEHHEPSFKCHMTIVMDGKPIESKFELQSGSPELRWDGDALVATFRVETPHGEMIIVFRYDLQEGGRRLRASEQLRGAGREQDNVWIFEQRSSSE